MKTAAFVTACLLASASLARAEATEPEATDEETGSGLVLVNATQKIGDLGKIDKLRRVLDSRGMLHKLPRRLEAALDGRAVLIDDVDAIREAFANLSYDAALELINKDEARILASATSGDPMPALAELSEWRGLIAAANSHEDEAVGWFRASYRFNPARQIDKHLVSPRVRSLIKKAHHEAEATGRLRVDADPETAEVRIDGGQVQAANEKLELPVGMHLVTVTAEGRTSYSELVEIREGKTDKLPITLDPESTDDKAAKLVDATVSAAPGKARLKKAKALSRVTGTKRYLVIEDAGDDAVTIRIYDVSNKKVSKPVDLLDSASSASIARLVNAALDPDNMVDATNVSRLQQPHAQRWYERWYVWAGVGALVGGGVLGYEYYAREPTSIRGF